MTDLYKYRVYCDTESQYVTTWMEAELTVCPNNNTHTITSGSITIIDQQLDKGPAMADGRPIVRAESRPLQHMTMFTMTGDTVSGIGDGQEMYWDFANNDDLVASGIAPDGYKMKRIKVSFLDPIYIKEGTNYFFDALKRSYICFSVICPNGQYYYNRTNDLTLATEDTRVLHYVNNHFFSGSCPMGDELNTESCTENPLPNNYELWIEVIVPDADNSSYGYGELEIFRTRTCLFPGESP